MALHQWPQYLSAKTHCPCCVLSGSECWEPASCSLLIAGIVLASEESDLKLPCLCLPGDSRARWELLPGSPCLFICSCISWGHGEAHDKRSSAGEKGAVGSPRSETLYPAPACTASTGLSPGPWDGKDSMGQSQLSLITLYSVNPGASSQPPVSLSTPITPKALRELRTCWLNILMGVSEGAGILAASPWLLARV